MATLHMNGFLAPTHQCRAQAWTGRKYLFQVFVMTPTGIEPILPISVERAATLNPINKSSFQGGQKFQRLCFGKGGCGKSIYSKAAPRCG